MQQATAKAPRGDFHEVCLAIERFLKNSKQPVLMEPGEDPLPVASDTFTFQSRGSNVTIECWSAARNLVRRAVAIRVERRGYLELMVERFGGLTGTVMFLDLDDPSNYEADRRRARLKFREGFRRSLRRQFTDWRLVELSTETDLHHSLSPSYPRAFLRKGSTAMAAIGAAEDGSPPEGALSFGLIWLDYLRRRETRLTMEGLALFLPAGKEASTCHRVRFLNPQAGRFRVFACDSTGHEMEVNPADYTNFATRIDPWRQALAGSDARVVACVERIAGIKSVEKRDQIDGSVVLSIRGLEFARAAGDAISFGLDGKQTARNESHFAEIEQIAYGLAEIRNPAAIDRTNPLYSRHPEAWLESQVRTSLEKLDASLLLSPVYGQVPQFAAGERGVADLLAADHDGRLVVIEIKASPDIHLPLQGLDYWMRVQWHLQREDFSGCGYFTGMALRRDPPRLLLVAPALEFHPENETVLRYFSPAIQVQRLGVGLEWRRDLRLMFRSPSVTWLPPSFAK